MVRRLVQQQNIRFFQQQTGKVHPGFFAAGKAGKFLGALFLGDCKTVADFIQDGNTLFINSGTTTLLVAEALKTKKNLSIVTNSLPIATLLGKVPTFRVILLGGTFNTQYAFTYGTDTQEQLNRYGADWAILSVDGVSPDGDISTCHAEEAIIDRLMITRAKKVLIVADTTKIGRTGFSYVSRCDNKIKILTNKK